MDLNKYVGEQVPLKKKEDEDKAISVRGNGKEGKESEQTDAS